METLKTILRRKSVRNFSEKQVPEKELESILIAGCAAPVGRRDYDSMHLTVLQDPSLIKKVSNSVNSEANVFYNSPTVIIISSKKSELEGIEYANAGCIAENMMLMATDLKIGSVYIWSVGSACKKNPELLKDLKIPADYFPVSSVALGYCEEKTDSEKQPKTTIKITRI